MSSIELPATKLSSDSNCYNLDNVETVRLTGCWIQVSELFKSRTDKENFWPTLTIVYSSAPGCSPVKEAILKKRWEQIEKDTLNFSAYYQALKASENNGRSDQELIAAAEDSFESRHGREFAFEYEWRTILRREARWIEAGTTERDLAAKANRVDGPGAVEAASGDSSLETPPEEEVAHQGAQNSQAGGPGQSYYDLQDEQDYENDMCYAENERKRLMLDAVRLQLEQDKADNELMEKDLSLLPDVQARQFFRLKKQSILSRLQAGAPQAGFPSGLEPKPPAARAADRRSRVASRAPINAAGAEPNALAGMDKPGYTAWANACQSLAASLAAMQASTAAPLSASALGPQAAAARAAAPQSLPASLSGMQAGPGAPGSAAGLDRTSAPPRPSAGQSLWAAFAERQALACKPNPPPGSGPKSATAGAASPQPLRDTLAELQALAAHPLLAPPSDRESARATRAPAAQSASASLPSIQATASTLGSPALSGPKSAFSGPLSLEEISAAVSDLQDQIELSQASFSSALGSNSASPYSLSLEQTSAMASDLNAQNVKRGSSSDLRPKSATPSSSCEQQ
ncbi:hypothetical protein PTTG_28603 [Puccinia triticina 1-1 BBBD Race 1]|uniref:NAM-associated domain-containing protein n=1 Tax=Puccinia triticina (isolate 1-1 / race 1 (BBBD)) TaxID=630390 RepID=A0A180GAE0_PUCT1|nr:hypothetical protein PTTG_28603 [Puccinia triticina 1-1 BBBD Race 1]